MEMGRRLWEEDDDARRRWSCWKEMEMWGFAIREVKRVAAETVDITSIFREIGGSKNNTVQRKKFPPICQDGCSTNFTHIRSGY
ncbi:hypothetical protein DM860_017800 [Cuscuta australis]|uniref:Uncharacterized protein n=1 Tax=Cuscuta australis TaxID=267555 RepID=A0A328DVE6_9ASTE|nr:hypothetical protein DM860_017800 [Cuscuta australis]